VATTKLPVWFSRRSHRSSDKVKANRWRLASWGPGGGNPRRPNAARQREVSGARISQVTVPQSCAQRAPFRSASRYPRGTEKGDSHLEGGLENQLIQFGVVQHSLQETSGNLVKYSSVFQCLLLTLRMTYSRNNTSTRRVCRRFTVSTTAR